MRKIKQSIPVGKLALNEGQIGWLPRNPRQWTKEDIERMIKSLDEDPDFMEDRPPLVTPQEDGGFCVFAGNERTEAEKKRRKRKEIEVIVYYPESDEDRETVIRRAIKDNGHFGQWDYDILANEWDEPLADWGVPAWDPEPLFSPASSAAQSAPGGQPAPQGVEGILPPELEGIQLTPDHLATLTGDGKTEFDRIIIVFPPARRQELADLLRLKSLDKVLYKIEEILDVDK